MKGLRAAWIGEFRWVDTRRGDVRRASKASAFNGLPGRRVGVNGSITNDIFASDLACCVTVSGMLMLLCDHIEMLSCGNNPHE
ncbi:MAG: hypothetical protein AAF561_06340 [Planctomycetota bacterium]